MGWFECTISGMMSKVSKHRNCQSLMVCGNDEMRYMSCQNAFQGIVALVRWSSVHVVRDITRPP